MPEQVRMFRLYIELDDGIERGLGGLFLPTVVQAHYFPGSQVSRRPGNDGEGVSGFHACFLVCQMMCEGNSFKIRVAMSHGFNCFPFIIILGEII